MEVLTINDILRNIVSDLYKKTNYNLKITTTTLKDLLKNESCYIIKDDLFTVNIIKDYRKYFINLIYIDVLEYLICENKEENKELLNCIYNMILNKMTTKFPFNNALTNKLLMIFIIITLDKNKKHEIRKNTLKNKKVLSLVKTTNPLFIFEE